MFVGLFHQPLHALTMLFLRLRLGVFEEGFQQAGVLIDAILGGTQAVGQLLVGSLGLQNKQPSRSLESSRNRLRGSS